MRLDPYTTGNHGLLRRQNLAGTIRLLYENAPISRVDLARLTGLNKTTVSSLIDELIENRFVLEVGVGVNKGAGRRKVLLAINPARGCILSGEMGADFVLVICTDFGTKVIWRKKASTAGCSQEEVIRLTLDMLREAAEAGTSQTGPVLGLSLGVPGLVDQKSGTLLFAPNLGWKNVRLGDVLAQSFSTMISVENEATLAALGEQYFGVAEGYNDVLYISAGVGLGGGLVLNGGLYNGSTGFASEFGHMTMDPDGDLCRCGNRGCWETQVSQAALFRKVKDAVNSGMSSVIINMAGGSLDNLTVEAIVRAAQSGDGVSVKALEYVGRNLGIGIASLVNALNPSLVVFGGVLSLAGEHLIPIATEELHRRALHWNEETARIAIARFGSEASVMGGVAKIFQAVLADPPRRSELQSTSFTRVSKPSPAAG